MKPIALPQPTQPTGSILDPLDGRYYDARTARYASEASSICYQAYVEAALAHTLAEFGVCSPSIAKSIEAASRKVTPDAVAREEATTHHNIKALVNVIKTHLEPKAQPYVHFGATSYDIICTSQAMQLRDMLQQVVIPQLTSLLLVLIDLAETHADTIQIGRTHGQHAVPITFGYAISEYVSRLGASTTALDNLSQELPGKFSGAVGAYNALSLFVSDPEKFETSLLARLGLKPAEYATQIVPPEAAVRVMDELAIAAGIMANLAHDMRHLQRTEIAEIQERFEKGQTGSSTMAHKRNPWNFENVASMSKQVLAQIVNANLNLSSEHQRDLTDSASSRFFVLAPAAVTSMASRLERVMKKIEVNRPAMQHNLHLTGGAIAAEPLYLLFEKYGHTTAHEKAKTLAHQSLSTNQPLVDVIASDTEAASYWDKFSQKERAIISHPETHYTGIASKKTKAITRVWKKRLRP